MRGSQVFLLIVGAVALLAGLIGIGVALYLRRRAMACGRPAVPAPPRVVVEQPRLDAWHPGGHGLEAHVPASR